MTRNQILIYFQIIFLGCNILYLVVKYISEERAKLLFGVKEID
jgi:hypothetical protein